MPYTQNPQALIEALKKLETGKNFTIVHIGDSHVQGDKMTGETRTALQQLFGNGGQGFLFPYGLAGSFGPRGTSAVKMGTWIPYKTLTPNLDRNLGITGYGITSYASSAEIHITFNEKFQHYPYTAIRVMESVDTTSFSTFITTENTNGLSLRLPQSSIYRGSMEPGNSWGVTEFSLLDNPANHQGHTLNQLPHHTQNPQVLEFSPLQQLHIEFQKNNISQTHVDFFGYQLVGANAGVVYHHYGVVGAQFPHFINRVKQACDQLAYIQPDLIIFSFGTNEAYNGKLSLEDYKKSVNHFIDSIQQVLPQVAILITTPPDTRSSGRIPPMQQGILKALKEIAQAKDVALFDLNRAMGGWGNVHFWHAAGLTLKDRVHFTTEGYGLQGKMITSCLLEIHEQALAKARKKVTAEEQSYQAQLNTEIYTALDDILRHTPALILEDTSTGKFNLSDSAANQILIQQEKSTPKDTVATTPRKPSPTTTRKSPSSQTKPVIHTVKSGENLYRIAQKYHVTTDAIAKANHLRNPRAIKPGQKLVIPK